MTMHSTTRRRAKGAAAVEAAIILPVIVSLLLFPIFFGIYFWHYTAIHKSAQNAARYLATVPAKDIKSVTPAGYVKANAEAIVREGIADLLPASAVLIDVQCDGLSCGDSVPSTVRVVVRLRIKDTFYGLVATGDDGWLITADVSMRYAGY